MFEQCINQRIYKRTDLCNLSVSHGTVANQQARRPQTPHHHLLSQLQVGGEDDGDLLVLLQPSFPPGYAISPAAHLSLAFPIQAHGQTPVSFHGSEPALPRRYKTFPAVPRVLPLFCSTSFQALSLVGWPPVRPLVSPKFLLFAMLPPKIASLIWSTWHLGIDSKVLEVCLDPRPPNHRGPFQQNYIWKLPRYRKLSHLFTALVRESDC